MLTGQVKPSADTTAGCWFFQRTSSVPSVADDQASRDCPPGSVCCRSVCKVARTDCLQVSGSQTRVRQSMVCITCAVQSHAGGCCPREREALTIGQPSQLLGHALHPCPSNQLLNGLGLLLEVAVLPMPQRDQGRAHQHSAQYQLQHRTALLLCAHGVALAEIRAHDTLTVRVWLIRKACTCVVVPCGLNVTRSLVVVIDAGKGA